MNRTLKLILSGVVWLALLAYIVFAVRMCEEQRESTLITKVEITVVEERERSGILTSQMIEEWIDQEEYYPRNKHLNKLSLSELKKHIETHSLVKSARLYTDDLKGALYIEVGQRSPIARFSSEDGYDFYITDDQWIIPITKSTPIYVPIVTGKMPLPFEPNFAGALSQIEDGLKEADNQAQLRHYEQLDSLNKIRVGLRSKEREAQVEQSKKEKKINKKRNEEEKSILTNALKQQEKERRSVYSAELRKLRAAENQAIEKERERLRIEKKERQNYLYLLKLINFVNRVRNDAFWDAQIVQINVKPQKGGTKNGSLSKIDNSLRWIEPEIEFIPRVGKHIVVLGTLDNVDEKLHKLMLLYRNVLNYEGWELYHTINLKYEGQIVCRERAKSKP